MLNKVVDFTKLRAIFIVLILIRILFAVWTDKFLTVKNVLNLIRQVAFLGIASVGLTFVMLTGGIDPSTGSIITMVNIFAAHCMVDRGNPHFWPVRSRCSSPRLSGLSTGFSLQT